MKKVLVSISLLCLFVLTACKDQKVEETMEEEPIVEQEQEEVVIEEDEEIEMNVTYSPTTGEMVLEEMNPNFFAAMIENSPKARPQTGLEDADVVYEIETEYEITRFLALFHDDIPDIVGPMRSSRHYFIPIAESWNAPYIHYGGSPQAYKMLKETNLLTIDGITQGKYFSRDNTRNAPHNAYFHPEELGKHELTLYPMLKHDEGYELQGEETKVIEIAYNYFTNVRYEYDELTQTYARYLEGEPHLDRESGEHIAPSNIVILYAKHEKIPNDDAGRIDVDLTSGGEALILFKGKKEEAIWKNEGGYIRFYINNKEVEFQPGKTWIQVVDTKKKEKVVFS